MIKDKISFFRFILDHPLTRRRGLKNLKDWLFWQIGSRMVPGDMRVPFVNDIFLWIHPGMTGTILNIMDLQNSINRDSGNTLYIRNKFVPLVKERLRKQSRL